MRRSSRRHKHPEINIVPLVDMLITLLFFFVLTMQFRTPSSETHSIRVPEIATKGPGASKASIEVAIDREGNLFWNGTRVTEAELAGLARQAAAGDNPRDLLVIADESSQTGVFYRTMDTLRRSGLQGMRLQTR